ncbi:MAG: amidase [Candidatus Adiutricales bacterium]
MSELMFQSATELLKAILDKRISSSELLEMYIERYERFNPGLNCIVATDFENARARAREADQALSRGENWGPLHGLPMTIKDSMEVMGMPCTWGAPLLKDYMPKKNADVVQPLIDAGAVIFGKTNIPLFAMDTQSFNEVYGQTNNPWDTSRTPGGSSGGSVTALAAGLTGLEIGSDIGGSIRSPAHFCGVYGHKPSYGVVPMRGQGPDMGLIPVNHPMQTDLSVTGPLARGPEDLDLVMDLVVRPSLPDRKAYSITLPPARKKALKEYRIGLWLDDPAFPVESSVGDRLQEAADKLAKAGAHVEDKRPEIDFARSDEIYLDLLNLATVWSTPQAEYDQLLDLIQKPVEPGQERMVRMIQGMTKSHREWQFLEIERLKLRQKWADFFKKFDALLCPAVRIPAFEHDHTELPQRLTRVNGEDQPHGSVLLPWAGLTIVAYLPATVAPVGLTPEGLPVGVQIVGPYLEDRTTIHLARLMTDVTGGFTPPPGY